MRQAWNGQPFGPMLKVEGTVYSIVDSGDTLSFRVDSDGVIRTITLPKNAARISVTYAGITITEVNNA